jgi:hypothetical protein
LLGWQSPEFNGWMRRGTFPLINLQPGEFVYFSCSTAARLVLLVSFVFKLLEFYGV